MTVIDRHLGEDVPERWLWRLAEAGDARAQVCVADDLLMSAYSRNRDAAEQWYRRAAQAGDPTAMMRLVNLVRGEDEQRRWLRAAVEADYPGAPWTLADYVDGDEQAEAEWEERHWLTRVAEPVQASAAATLGALLEATDRWEEAEGWYRRAAEAGHRDATCYLAYVNQRSADADYWLRRAVETGTGVPPEHLGELTEQARRLAGGAWRHLGIREAMTWFAESLTRVGRHEPAETWRHRAAQVRRQESMAKSLGYEVAVLATAVLAAGAVPFLQVLVRRAAEDTYDGVRSWLRRLFVERRSVSERLGPGSHELLIVEDPDPRLRLALQLWTDTPDASIAALADLDLAKVAGDPRRRRVNRVRIYWNQASRSWQALDDVAGS